MKQIFFLLLLIVPLSTSAQTKSLQKSAALVVAAPESVEMSSARLARIDAICQKAIDNSDVPGIVALVARKGKIVYHKSFGVSDSESNHPLEKDDIFRIASQTKAITATAVMMLWEEGHFRLDDAISKWIPEFKNPKVLKNFRYADTTYTTISARSEITIRHLLTHTSGLGYGIIDPHEGMKLLFAKNGIREISSTSTLTTEKNVKNLAKLPLHFHPGEKYQYSMGLDVLAFFVEIVSGLPFDEFLQQRLFKPLGMSDTHFYLPNEKEERLVRIHEPGEGGWHHSPILGEFDPDFPITGTRTLHSGGGGLSSTAKDYASFLQMYLNGGELNGKRILSRTTVQSIMGNQIGDFWQDSGRHYGLAFGVVTDQGQDKGGNGSTGTFSWGGAFNTQYFADPKEEIIGVLFKQTLNARKDKTGWQFKQLVGQSILSEHLASQLSLASAESVGMSSERLDRIENIIEIAIEKNAIPGAVALVARDGQIVYHKAFGSSDNASNRKMKKDDIFRIASQTKAITATATMMLWEEGHFRLDDPISKWIPEFKDPVVLKNFRYSDTTFTTKPAESEITIRQLLTHTSGLGYGIIDPHEGMRIIFKRDGIQEIASQSALTTEQNVKNLANLPLHFNPGEKYQYAMGLDVLGHFIEIISGKPFEVFLQERLFTPLGMEDTYFHLPESKGGRLVAVQKFNDGKWESMPVTSWDPEFPLTGYKEFSAGGGGLVSSAKDYATFLQMYLNGGSLNGIQILSPTTIQSMMGNQIGNFWGDSGKYYGLAFGVLDENGQDSGGSGSTGTFDWGGYFNTSYFADPKEKTIGILMKQTRETPGDQTGWQFRLLVGQAIDN